MLLSIKTVDLNNLDIDNLKLPTDKFNCYVICNSTSPNKELLSKLIEGEAKDINVCGKWSSIWEEEACRICAENEYYEQKPEDWYVTTEDSSLDLFISSLAFSHCEYYDNETLSHDPIVLFYDDEKLKDFVIKRVEWYLEDTKNSKDYDYWYESLLKERAELSVHTNRTVKLGVSDARDMILAASHYRLPALAITDTNSTQSLIEAYEESKTKSNIKIIYGSSVYAEQAGKVNILCKNVKGKRVLYDHLTYLFTKKEDVIIIDDTINYFPYAIKENILDDNRNDIVIGLCFDSKATSLAFLNSDNIDEIRKYISYCDYVEVAPISTYKFHYPNKSEEEIKDVIKLIIKIAKEEDKPVVAVSSPYYSVDSEYLAFSLLWEKQHNTKLPDDYCGRVYATEEMRYAFDWLNDDDLVEEIVVTNTHKISDMCEEFELIDESYHAPKCCLNGNYDELLKRASLKLHGIYGSNIDPLIQTRFNDELRIIKENNTSSIFFITSEIFNRAKEDGYENGVRGSIGATLVGFLLGISKCNPLPPHYVCPNCHKVIWMDNDESGFDLKPIDCEECGTTMLVDGHNIPYETFMGLNGEKRIDIDVNTSSNYLKKVESDIKKIAPDNQIINSGIVNTINFIDAKSIVEDFAGNDNSILDEETKEEIAYTLNDVACGQAACLNSYFIVPNDTDIKDYTPLDNVKGILSTHVFGYELIDYFYKADFLKHADPECFKFFKDNGLDINEVNIFDPKIFELINGNKEDLLGIPEFGDNELISKIIEKTKPKVFSDLVKISCLAHGTRTWKNNGEKLIEQGINLDDLLGSRDDVFNTLVKHGTDRIDAYEIMEDVRKGKGLTKEQEEIIRKHNLPDWFIDSCNTILYMFPKAHAVSNVINYLIYAWAKIYKPALFYASYFNFKASQIELDTMCKSPDEIKERISELTGDSLSEKKLIETLSLACEMSSRGIKLVNKNVKDFDKTFVFEVNPNNSSEILVKNTR